MGRLFLVSLLFDFLQLWRVHFQFFYCFLVMKRALISDTIAYAFTQMPLSAATELARLGAEDESPNSPNRFPAVSTVYYLRTLDSSPEARKERRGRKGIHTTFTRPIKKLIVGYALYERTKFRSVTGDHLIRFSQQATNLRPSSSTITRIMKAWGMSSQKSVGRNSRQVDTAVWTDAMTILEDIRSRGLLPEQILVMDETGLWSNHVQRRTYHGRSRYAIRFFTSVYQFHYFTPLDYVWLFYSTPELLCRFSPIFC